MARVLSFLLLALLGSALPAAQAADIRVLKDVTFLPADRAEKLDLYLPAAPAAGKTLPAVVFIHGGGWTGGTKDEARAHEICTALAEHGYVAVNAEYKRGDNCWPTNLFDCKNAVRFLRAHAAEYQVDPNRIGVAGGSAGGHLALMVAFTAGKKGFEPEAPYPGVSSAVRCVIDMYGPTDLLTRKQIAKDGTPTNEPRSLEPMLKPFGATEKDTELFRSASPVTHVAKNSPAVLIFHGHADTTVDYTQSEELDRVLTQHGVEHEVLYIEGVGHAFGWETTGKKKMPKDLRPIALKFLDKHLRS